jgi:hypothetical protein
VLLSQKTASTTKANKTMAAVSGYARLRERQLNKPLDMENGIPQMTLYSIKQLCMQRGGYETPELNDTLYLQ